MAQRKQLENLLHQGREAAKRELGEDAHTRLREAAWSRFNALMKAAPSFNDRVNRGLFDLAVPLVALYKALRLDMGLSEPAALKLAEAMLAAAFEANFGPIKRVVWSLGMDIVPLRNLLIKKTLSVNEPRGFRFEKAPLGTAAFGFDVKSCAIVNFAREHEAAEVVPLICRLDDIMAEHLQHFTLRRTGTIGMGAEQCDFRYYRRT